MHTNIGFLNMIRRFAGEHSPFQLLHFDNVVEVFRRCGMKITKIINNNNYYNNIQLRQQKHTHTHPTYSNADAIK